MYLFIATYCSWILITGLATRSCGYCNPCCCSEYVAENCSSCELLYFFCISVNTAQSYSKALKQLLFWKYYLKKSDQKPYRLGESTINTSAIISYPRRKTLGVTARVQPLGDLNKFRPTKLLLYMQSAIIRPSTVLICHTAKITNYFHAISTRGRLNIKPAC